MLIKHSPSLRSFHRPLQVAAMTARSRSFSTTGLPTFAAPQPLRRTFSTCQPAWEDMPFRAFSTSAITRDAQPQAQVNPLTPPSTPPPGSALDFVRIVEVAPRDGLQNIPGKAIPTDIKLELVNKLVDAGLRGIEVGSFVRPDWVPQVCSNYCIKRLTADGRHTDTSPTS